jgi:hypothetical protein
MDEAGYGPNLGPLVVVAAVFRVGEGIGHEALYDVLNPGVTALPGEADAGRLLVADSKKVYRPGGSLGPLERTMFAAWNSLRAVPTTLEDVWSSGDAQYGQDAGRIPWFVEQEILLPVGAVRDGDGPNLVQTGGDHDPLPMSQRVLPPAGAVRSVHPLDDPATWPGHEHVSLVGLFLRVVDCLRFNMLLRRWGNKSQLLSRVTLGLAAEISQRFPDDLIDYLCDRHGGRRTYAGLIQSRFPEQLVRVVHEDREMSHYVSVEGNRPIKFQFRTKSERFLAPALASMLAKYVRELSMLAFNRFWSIRLRGLRPTAGYPVDAIRFCRDIATVQRAMNLPDWWVWRQL